MLQDTLPGYRPPEKSHQRNFYPEGLLLRKTSTIHIKWKALMNCLVEYQSKLAYSKTEARTSILLDMEEELLEKHPEAGVLPMQLCCLDIRQVNMWIANKIADLHDHNIVYAMYND
jgi:hypothetical protein